MLLLAHQRRSKVGDAQKLLIERKGGNFENAGHDAKLLRSSYGSSLETGSTDSICPKYINSHGIVPRKTT